MQKNIGIYGFSLAVCIAFCSCGNKQAGEGAGNDTAQVAAADTTPVNELANYHFNYTLANLPPPMQVLDEFAKSNLPVDPSLLNPADNVDNYRSSLKQAFNYGIYGVDLGYLVVNNRTLDVIKYYGTAKKLAEQLNMSETFNRFVDRFETNKENKDTLTRVVDEAYAATDSYLRSNERLETASQVMAGSWLECQYLTVSLLKNAERTAENEILFQRVWEQRLYLDNITKLLSEFKDDKELNKIKNDFEKLLVIYKEPSDASLVNKDFLNRLSKSLETTRANVIK